MRRAPLSAVVVLFILSVLSFPSTGAPPQPATCPPGPPPPEALQVTIGHFAEGEDEVAEFCRYLVRNLIWPTLLDLGSIRDPAAVREAEAALDSGKVDVLWLNTSAIGTIASGSTLLMKVAAVTDFLSIHVITRDPAVRLVTDNAFAPADVRVEAMVRRGRSEFYADALFAALGRGAPQCLTMIDCAPHAGVGFAGAAATFLLDKPSRAVVLATRPPDAIVRALLHPPFVFRLVGIPSGTVARMHPVRGTVIPVPIARGLYGLQARPDVPGTDVPTAGAPMMLVSGTPAPVVLRVEQLATRVNSALLSVEPRLPREMLQQSQQMVREMAEQLPGRLVLHAEYAKQLQARGLLVPGVPIESGSPQPLPGPTLPPTTVSVVVREFSVTPQSIRAGERAQLCWVIDGASVARIEPEIGSLNTRELEKGCRPVSPTRTTAYVLSATGRDGRTVQARAILSITEQPTPTVSVEIREFSVTPRSIRAGARAQLCWVVDGARAARIEPEIGSLNTRELEKGCRPVSPTRTTTYVLSATGRDGRTVQTQTILLVLPETVGPSRLSAPRPLRPGGSNPTAPAIVSCATVELVWAAVGGRAPVSYTATLEVMSTARGWSPVQVFTTQQTRIDVSHLVREGATYRWNVRARDAAGVTSEPSLYLYFGCLK